MNRDGRPTSRKTQYMTSRKTQYIACPKCDARFPFCRNSAPEIDSCGFENYRLECKECKTGLSGIIDPNDEELLLSKFADESAGIPRR
jgi:hypothetical protein